MEQSGRNTIVMHPSSPLDNFHMKQYEVHNSSEVTDNEWHSSNREYNKNSSHRSSQSLNSFQSFEDAGSQCETSNAKRRSNLHPHVSYAYADHELEETIPNSNDGNEDEDGSLTKQIDDTRRDAAMCLSEKREKKAELIRMDSQKSKENTIGIFKMAQYSISMSFLKCKEAIKGVFYTLELWYSSLKLIEGNFGSGIASYFKFLRWLFLLNLTTLIISFSFLVIPQILLRIFVNTSEIPEVTRNGGTYMETKFSDPPGLNGTIPPPLTAAALLHRSNPYGENAKFYFGDLFTGEGFLTATSMYYGFYKNGSLELVEGYPYDLPNAYFFSMVVCYMIILVTVSVSMARSYRKTFIETKGSQQSSLAHKVLCGWDYSIATSEAACLNKKRVFNEIKEALNEEEFQDQDSSFLSHCTTITVQLSLNVMFIFLMTGIALLMWDLLGRHSTYLYNSSDGSGSSSNNTMTMAIIISLIMNVLPMCFSWIVRYEDYRNPRTALYVTLLRTFLLNVIVIGTLIVFWLTHPQECWETSLGQEVYRLFITDFIISTLLMGLVETSWSLIRRQFRKEHSSPPEFDIASSTLNLIYNQTLFMVGFYFSPLLAAVIVIKLFITFYIKKAGVFHNCQPPRKSWRAAQTQTVFLILTFIALLGVFLGFGFIILRVSPSKCGPFSGFTSMVDAILGKIFQLEKTNIFWKAVIYLIKPGVIAGILIAMSIAAYILRAQAQAHTIEADILKNMLMKEKKDKAFLFKYIKKTEEMNQRRGSPAISHSSSFHTPLSERRQMRKVSLDKMSSPLMTPYKSPRGSVLQRRFHSASQIGVGSSWSYGVLNLKGMPKPHETSNQPSTSSGASGTTWEIELSEMGP